MLLLGRQPVSVLQDIAAKLDGGVLVVVVPDEELQATRQECADYDNAMVLASDPAGSIPWKDEFFSKVFAPLLDEPNAELMRILAPDGLMFLSTGTYPRPSAV